MLSTELGGIKFGCAHALFASEFGTAEKTRGSKSQRGCKFAFDQGRLLPRGPLLLCF